MSVSTAEPSEQVPAEPAPAAAYRDRLDAGEIPYQRCGTCRAAVFPPRVLCPACGGLDLTWAASAGPGVVYSATRVTQFDGSTSGIALVDLAEGFRMMSNIVGDVDAIRVGMPVEVRWAASGEWLLPVFAP